MKTRLIVALIAQDMKHEQLLGAFEKIGFQSDIHELLLLDIIAEVMGVPPKKMSWDWVDIYMKFMKAAEGFEITGNGKNLLPLAEACYAALKTCIEKGMGEIVKA
jgi:hypothetical protein